MGLYSTNNAIASLFSIPENISGEEGFLETLSHKINALIIKDFNGLISILYRLDIDETKLRTTLSENTNEDAGMLIARMIMEREQKKSETRKMFRNQHNSGEEERW